MKNIAPFLMFLVGAACAHRPEVKAAVESGFPALSTCEQPTLQGALQQTAMEPFECFHVEQEADGQYLMLLLVRGGDIRGPELPDDTYARWQVTAERWLKTEGLDLASLEFDGNMRMMPPELTTRFGFGYYVRAVGGVR